jgi:hypothetical protein
MGQVPMGKQVVVQPLKERDSILEECMVREMQKFLDEWEEDPSQVKRSFVRLKDYLAAKGEQQFTFKVRPGVSYSLRARHPSQKRRDLFVIVDIIDDDPSNRWLSVCFYPDMISDREERGNLIPSGLLGEDGYCFDYEEWDEEYLGYLLVRLDEAHHNASKE